MDSDKYLEGQSMQRPPLFESDSFIYWKNRFETYVKSKDLDLWHVITNGDFQPIEQNPKTKLDEVIPFEKQSDDLKKRLAKNNEAKMVIYNALPRKEYERIFMCNAAKEIWKTLLITHQGNNQVKDNKIDLLEQQYEQFVISEDESIDSAFARFNTIITSLKALDESYSSKNYVRKFLRDLHPKWRLRKNLAMRSVRLLEVKTKNTPWRLETSRSSSREEVYSVETHLRTTKRRSKEAEMTRKAKVIENVLRGEEDDEKAPKTELSLVLQALNEISLESTLEPDEGLKEADRYKHMTGTRKLLSKHKAYNGRCLLEVTAAKISLLEDMDSESAHMVAASKVLMLKPENGNTAPKITVVEGVEKIIPPTTAEEKA
ncbi:hypothetical protein Tco_0378841 [Tanacetum coccineum]